MAIHKKVHELPVHDYSHVPSTRVNVAKAISVVDLVLCCAPPHGDKVETNMQTENASAWIVGTNEARLGLATRNHFEDDQEKS